MGKAIPRSAVQHSDFSNLRWYFAVVVAGCAAWLFYTVFWALR
jgi:hypothetical protein